MPIDTTSFSVKGEYLGEGKTSSENKQEEEVIPMAIVYGYSREHRADLKQWMVGKVRTHDGDIPIFLRPLDGKRSDKKSISAIVTEVMTQLRETQPEDQEERLAVFESGGYSQENMKRYNEAKISWVSRVPETSPSGKNGATRGSEGMASPFRWFRAIQNMHHGFATRKGTLGDRAHRGKRKG